MHGGCVWAISSLVRFARVTPMRNLLLLTLFVLGLPTKELDNTIGLSDYFFHPSIDQASTMAL